MYLVMNIGCIECGVSSKVVGVFADKSKAESVAKTLDADAAMSWREGGQNSFEVFTLPKPEIVDEEYEAALAAKPST